MSAPLGPELIGYVREYRAQHGSSLLEAKAAVLAGWRPGDSPPPPDPRDAEIARLRARLAEVEGAALRLCDEIAPTLSHVHDDAMVALRAVLSRTEGRTPEVKP